MEQKQKQKGLTLVEILVVVSLIAFLATGIFFGDIFSFRKKANEIKEQSVFQLAELVIEQYANLCGQYPPQVDGGTSLPFTASKGCPPGTTLANLISASEEQDMAGLLYVPYASVYADNCVGYHLAITVGADSALLKEDHDVDSSMEPEGVTHCVADASTLGGIDGSDPVYDIMKPASLRGLF